MRVVYGAVLLWATILVAAPPLLAGETTSQNATLISPAPVHHAGEIDAPAELQVGPVRGELILTSPSGRYGAGSSAFVQITLATDIKQSRGLHTEILLDAKYGEIVGVSGDLKEAAQDPSTYRAQIEGLRKGRDKSVLVEMKLGVAPDNSPNTLKFTLRSQNLNADHQDVGFAEKTIEMHWVVANCANEYQTSLRKIGDNGGNDLLELWRSAAQQDKAAPRRWIFEPNMPKRQRGGRAKDSKNAERVNARAIYSEAGRLLRSGRDPAFARRGNLDWVITKTSADLKKYLSQDDHPAICTGADRFTRYYEDRLSPLKRRGDQLRKIAEDAKQLMRQETKEVLVELALSAPSGHPAWGGASLAILNPIEEISNDAKGLIVAIAKALNLPENILSDISASKYAYDALLILDQYEGIGKDAFKRGSKFHAALSAVEAFLHLDYALMRQKKLEAGFFGSLNAIKGAHSESCNCNG